jgi:hypothetical protein
VELANAIRVALSDNKCCGHASMIKKVSSTFYIIWNSLVYICPKVLRLYYHEQISPKQSHLLVIVHEYSNRARRHRMWRNLDYNGKSKPFVAWKKCTKPKKKG